MTSPPQAMHEDTESSPTIATTTQIDEHHHQHFITRPSVLSHRAPLLVRRTSAGFAFDASSVVVAPVNLTLVGKRKDRVPFVGFAQHESVVDDGDADDEDSDHDDNDDDDDDSDSDTNNVVANVQSMRVSGELTQKLKRFRLASTSFSITIRTLTGRQLLLSVHGTDTVDDLKTRIEELEGIPVAQQRLVFGGRVLPDVDSLRSHNITDEGTELHLVLALRGGVCCASPNCPCVSNVVVDDFFTSLRRRSTKKKH